MNRRKKMSIILIVLFLAVWIILIRFHWNRFGKNHHITIGRVISTDGGGKGNWGPGINYQYLVGNAWENGKLRNTEFSYSNSKILEGHNFPVIYSKNLFWTDNVILITPNDFKYYGYAYPDSLKWVLPIINSKQ